MALKLFIFILNFILICHQVNSSDDEGIYRIGAGISDITGPASEMRMIGYVNPLMFAGGIHTRLFSRAYIIESLDTGSRIVFVTVDMGMFDQALKLELIRKLQLKYGDLYTSKNIVISCTHTHSGPSGFIQYYTYLIESFGFSPVNFNGIAEGVVESIQRAHEKMVQGRIYKNIGRVDLVSSNRSPEAYLNNPQDERDRYIEDIDRTMTLLRFEDLNGTPIAMLNWFAIHPISFNSGFNQLVSSDNKGVPSIMFEYEMNGMGVRPGRGEFVGAFASTNLGDVNPRHNPIVENPRFVHYPDQEIKTGLENVRIAGERQFRAALELFNYKDNATLITGPIQYAHQYIDMSSYIPVTVINPDTGEEEIKTSCPAAAGMAFIESDMTPIWAFIEPIIPDPSPEIIECQKPKEIAIPVGEMNSPFAWGPSIVDTQILRLGNLEIIAVPGEFTTMAGRRMREKIDGISGDSSVIAGISNLYTHYIVTPEEYDVQDYEGGSTLYGKYTLDVYLDQYSKLMSSMIDGELLPNGPPPPDYFSEGLLESPNPPKVDDLASGTLYGECIREPYPIAYVGEQILAVFVAGSLRHNSNRGGTYFNIERLNGGKWEVVRNDADLDTLIFWKKSYMFVQQSRVEIIWDMPLDALPGTYRIRHFGSYLEVDGGLAKPYIGVSKTFEIRAEPATLILNKCALH